jgi:5'(3')-deoxyribonucleotidase
MATLFIDMDGVVADLYVGCVDFMQSNYGTIFNQHDWDIIKNEGRIFRNLPITSYANDLMNVVYKFKTILSRELKFLTVAPADMPYAYEDKIYWAALYYPAIPVISVPTAETKQHYIGISDIIIDDNIVTCNQCVGNGGTAVYVDKTIPYNAVSKLELLLNERLV